MFRRSPQPMERWNLMHNQDHAAGNKISVRDKKKKETNQKTKINLIAHLGKKQQEEKKKICSLMINQ